MTSDDPWPAASPRRFTRFGLVSFFVLMAAIAVAIAIVIELSKSEVTAYLQVARSITPPGWSPEWFPEMSDSEYDLFRLTQVELLRSKPLLTRALRDPSISHYTFLARIDDPVDWLKKNLKIDYPNDAELLRIRLFTSKPEEGVKIVNAVVHNYFKEVVERGVTDRAKAEAKLRDLLSQFDDQLVHDKNDVQRLAAALGPEAAAKSVELELKQTRIRQLEDQSNDISRQLQRLRIARQVPPRVQLIDEAHVDP